MEHEIEDIVGDVKLTDSQKSVATSNVYSMDFTDSCSDKNNSSGKDTYVIELDDSEDSDSYPIHKDKTVIDLNGNGKNKNGGVQCEAANESNKIASTIVQNCCVVSQEIFTQTSRTIFQLAAEDINKESLETQTSFVSIRENKTLEYKIHLSNGKQYMGNNYQSVLRSALEDESSKFQESDSDTIKSDNSSVLSSEVRNINVLTTESKENVLSDENQATQYPITSELEESNDSDIEPDSLMETKDQTEIDTRSDNSEPPKSVDDEIEDLYNRLNETIEMHGIGRHQAEKQYTSALTPLTEESKRDSLIDITCEMKRVENSVEDDKDVIFTNFAGGRVKMLPKVEDKGEFRLPPIQNRSCPNSPHLNFLFSVHPSNRLNKAGTLPCLYEATEKGLDRWEIGTKELASGESPLITGRGGPIRSTGSIHLPPIHIEGFVVKSKINTPESKPPIITNVSRTSTEIRQDAINIKEKIKELKIVAKTGRSQPRIHPKFNIIDSRSCSPDSGVSHESKLCEAAERGCEALCAELLRRLRSASWFEVSDTLEEIPKVMEKFWSVITEQRIADLIRQVSAQIESPRTQVARTACNALACILKNTSYTKKPDFYEAVTVLLMKTGSFCRPVRRAANMALDAIVSGVELSHAVTALCLHGVEHKSPLVRCAAARLLVVSCALAGGGRELLRARPPTAAGARRHALRSLSMLLDDKSTDARKYAERLYSMLRPLANFEAYYLTDVDVELASRQMKKYDRLLLCDLPKDPR